MNIFLLFLPVIACPLLSRALSGDRSFGDAEGDRRAPFQPPSWVFGPVWFCLYLLMGVALNRVDDRNDRGAQYGMALLLFLNVMWTPVFLRGYLKTSLLIIVAMIAQASALSHRTEYLRALIAPYVAWLVYAALLNAYYITAFPQSSSELSSSSE